MAECPKGFLGRVDNRLALQVERGVEHYGNAGSLSKVLDQPVIFRVHFFLNSLKPRCAIHVCDGGENLPLSFPYVHHVEHEASWIVPWRFGQCKVLLCTLSQYRRSKGTERLAELDLDVDDVLHIGTPRVGQDAPIPQRTRPPFKPILEPPYDLSGLKFINNPLYQLLLAIEPPIMDAFLSQELFDLARTVLLSPVGMRQNQLTRLTQNGMMSIEGRSNRPAAVTG